MYDPLLSSITLLIDISMEDDSVNVKNTNFFSNIRQFKIKKKVKQSFQRRGLVKLFFFLHAFTMEIGMVCHRFLMVESCHSFQVVAPSDNQPQNNIVGSYHYY